MNFEILVLYLIGSIISSVIIMTVHLYRLEDSETTIKAGVMLFIFWLPILFFCLLYFIADGLSILAREVIYLLRPVMKIFFT